MLLNQELMWGTPFIVASVLGSLILILLITFRSKISIEPYTSKRPEKDDNIILTKKTEPWAMINGFNFLGYYVVYCGSPLFMAAWQQKNTSVYLCQYVFFKKHLIKGYISIVVSEFVTNFKNQIELTTCDANGSNLFPKPLRNYHQSFSVNNMDELYGKHQQAEEFLIKKFCVKPENFPLEFERTVIDSLRRSNKHQWQHWYWFLFLPYFYFIRRYKMHNKSVEKQYELDLIRDPEV